MARRESNIASAAQAHAQAKRVAERGKVKPSVSWDAIANMIERECNKAGREWYGKLTACANEIEALKPESRKAARQMVLARLDGFPVKS